MSYMLNIFTLPWILLLTIIFAVISTKFAQYFKEEFIFVALMYFKSDTFICTLHVYAILGCKIKLLSFCIFLQIWRQIVL